MGSIKSTIWKEINGNNWKKRVCPSLSFLSFRSTITHEARYLGGRIRWMSHTHILKKYFLMSVIVSHLRLLPMAVPRPNPHKFISYVTTSLDKWPARKHYKAFFKRFELLLEFISVENFVLSPMRLLLLFEFCWCFPLILQPTSNAISNLL